MTDEQDPGPEIRALPIFAMVIGALAVGAGVFDVFIAGATGARGFTLMGVGLLVVVVGIVANQRN